MVRAGGAALEILLGAHDGAPGRGCPGTVERSANDLVAQPVTVHSLEHVGRRWPGADEVVVVALLVLARPPRRHGLEVVGAHRVDGEARQPVETAVLRVELGHLPLIPAVVPRDDQDGPTLVVVELAIELPAFHVGKARKALGKRGCSRRGALRKAEAQHTSVGGRAFLEPTHDTRCQRRGRVAHVLVVDPQIALFTAAIMVVIVMVANRHEAGVVGIVAHVVVVIREHTVAPMHNHVALVLGWHDNVVDDRIRRQLRVFSEAGSTVPVLCPVAR